MTPVRLIAALGASLALAACTSAATDSFPLERYSAICVQTPDTVTLAKAALSKDPDERTRSLGTLAAQAETKATEARKLADEYSGNAALQELAAAAGKYADAIDTYRALDTQFAEPLGNATLAEGDFYDACRAALP